MLNILLPSLPYERVVDPMWQDELDAARHHGYAVCLFDAEQNKLYQPPNPQYATLYRGWMLTATAYEKLAVLTPLLVPTAMYLASHQASGWYAAIAGFTPASTLLPASAAATYITALLQRQGRCFIKGLSKSFGADSVVASAAAYEALRQEHGVGPEELLLVREYVDLSDEPEQRFFAVRGDVFGAAGQVFPAALRPAIHALQARWFYTVDVAFTRTGQPIIVEVGDGQVSDTKEWPVAELYRTVLSRVAASTAELAASGGPR